MLNYLATQPKLENFVTQALVQVYARITKQGWFDSNKQEFIFRNVIPEITKFLNVSCNNYPQQQNAGFGYFQTICD